MDVFVISNFPTVVVYAFLSHCQRYKKLAKSEQVTVQLLFADFSGLKFTTRPRDASVRPPTGHRPQNFPASITSFHLASLRLPYSICVRR